MMNKYEKNPKIICSGCLSYIKGHYGFKSSDEVIKIIKSNKIWRLKHRQYVPPYTIKLDNQIIIDVSKHNGFFKRIKEIIKFIFTGRSEFILWKN